mmetsp:Transcript_22159/g.31662  ORF Transcript_22159/g.31662 Transcript_22159/m.31662 type:complete len:212 (-) Transcript_22159:185-820(-)|eukprot:CAMPEP_0201686114 /NCGR_PEP_ID=MMETSP0578-20130828/672_1 /ASSEMBLY_ACC=CAM_ASM_000663 /TAXON_ID=267565 /ORGANISM="Skeletonema grethea, Strain CCMP 1804" /LENGTH=211 /DNA_ID=CAMNT_0048170119 /DNA_START=89 /DNA_END=724 /DNA_ORIENTATION=-
MGDENDADYVYDQMQVYLCPSWALSLGYMGVAAGAVLSNWGSAWGTWKSGVSLLNTGIQHPGSVMKNVIPIVMAGVIGIYGLIVAVILAGNIPPPTVGSGENIYSVYTGMAHLCAGLCCGLSGLAAGGCIGIIGDYGVRSVGYRTSNISVIFSTDKSSGFDGGDDDGAGSGDENKLFVGMLIMLIFSEALALYGLIVALIVSQHAYSCGGE